MAAPLTPEDIAEIRGVIVLSKTLAPNHYITRLWVKTEADGRLYPGDLKKARHWKSKLLEGLNSEHLSTGMCIPLDFFQVLYKHS